MCVGTPILANDSYGIGIITPTSREVDGGCAVVHLTVGATVWFCSDKFFALLYSDGHELGAHWNYIASLGD